MNLELLSKSSGGVLPSLLVARLLLGPLVPIGLAADHQSQQPIH